MSRPPVLIGLLLAVVTVVTLALAHRSVGYVRDEGVYFEAGRSYAAWASKLVRTPGEAMRAKVRDRHFGINHEHPALMKLAGGLGGRLFAHAPVAEAEPDRDVDLPDGGLIPIMREGAAMRLPAQIVAGFGVFLLFVAGRRFGNTTAAGLLAAGWFILQPRVFFHAGLDAFDVPIAVATLAVVLAYRRALDDRGWGIGVGVVLGIAIAVKHNALFIGPLLYLHYLACLGHARVRQGRKLRLAQILPLPFVSMAVLAPLVAVALWPWLWSDPIARIGDYFAFHREHAYYNMEFLGHNYNRPPLPISYPLVMTFATVPAVLLALGGLGLAAMLRTDLRRDQGLARGASDASDDLWGSFMRPLPAGWPRLDGALLAIFALFPMALIALPSIPIFGGTKHWLTAYPFWALAAATAWGRMWARAQLPARWRHAPALALVVVLVPGTWATIDGHPYGLSQYAPLVGGPRGAAELGLNRGFWGHAITPLLDSPAPPPGSEAEGALPTTPTYLHDVHESARRQYAREGRWPAHWKPANLAQARAGLIFHEKHMIVDEVGLWNALGTTRPRVVLTLDDVPLTTVYGR